MKPAFTLFIFLLSTFRTFAADLPPEATRLKTIFVDQSEKIDTALEKERTAAGQKYRDSLNRIQDHYAKKGNLEEVLLVKNELIKLEKDPAVPLADRSGSSRPIDQARAVARTSCANAEKMHRARKLKLLEGYTAKLKSLMRGLTQAERLDEALLVQQIWKDAKAELAIVNAKPDTEPAPARASVKDLLSERAVYYSFDRPLRDGRWIVDESGNERDAEARDVAVGGVGRKGTAGKFDAETALFFAPIKGYRGPVTIACWIQTRNRDYQTLLDAGGMHRGLTLYTEDGSIRFGYRTDGDLYASVTGPRVANGHWHHIAAVVDETPSIHLYVDGRPAGTSECTLFKSDPLDKFVIGGDHMSDVHDRGITSGAPRHPYSGLIDDFTFFYRDLSPREVKALYSSR